MTVPFLSILVPVYQPDVQLLRECLRSVTAQTDEGWELIVSLDGPQSDEVSEAIAEVTDERVQVVERAERGGISAATNSALEQAGGEFVTFVDNDDLLAPFAVEAVREAAEGAIDVDVIYSDEDKIDADGNRVDPFFKPAWSPQRLLCQMYLGHLSVYRRSLVDSVGGLRPEFDGSQDHDLALRCTARARRIAHVPRVLYHWRQSDTSTALDPASKSWAFEAGARAVGAHLEDQAIPAAANFDEALSGVVAVDPQLTEFPLVSIVVLTGGTERVLHGRRRVLVEHALGTLLERTTYPRFEVIVVLDRNADADLGERLRRMDPSRVRIARDHEPFNFSAANHLGVQQAKGSVLVFLNDDTEVLTPDWVERLVLWATRPGVGAVGACLLYPDGRIQHAGVVSRDSGPSHRWAGFPADHPGTFQSLRLTLNHLAVTGACLAIERDVFFEVGGFCTELPLNFNDVDLCLKLVQAGYHNVLDNRTRLIHFETSSRPSVPEAWEVEFLFRRWAHVLAADPWDNPWLTGPGVEDVPLDSRLTELCELLPEQPHPRYWPALDET